MVARRTAAPATRTLSMVRGRAKTIQLIHIGAVQCRLIDPVLPKTDPDHDVLYRTLIESTTDGQARSCAACTDVQLEAVLGALRDLGFRPEPATRQGRRPANMTVGDMRSKVEALLTSMSLPWGYAEAVVRRQRGLPDDVACPVCATTALELRYLIAALSTEQGKRDSLAAIDRLLAAAGLTRDAIAARCKLRPGWESRRQDLAAALADLTQAAGACHA